MVQQTKCLLMIKDSKTGELIESFNKSRVVNLHYDPQRHLQLFYRKSGEKS